MKELNLKEKKIIAREFLFFIICLVIAILTFLAIYPYNYITQNQCIKYRSEIAKKTTKIKAFENKQNDDLLNIVQKMIDYGQTEENIAIVIRKYTTTKIKTDSIISKNFVPPLDGVAIESKNSNAVDEYGVPILKHTREINTHNPRQILKNFVIASNSGKFKLESELLSKFPELKGYDYKILQEYVATANNSKYGGNYDVINSKFPEFKSFLSEIDTSLHKVNSLKEEIQILERRQKDNNDTYIKSNTQLKIAGVAFLISFLVLFILRYVYYGVKWSVGVLRIS